MTQYKKAITYTNFKALPAEERKLQSSYFQSLHPETCPVALSLTHINKDVELRNCKFLIFLESTIYTEQARLRQQIIKYSNGVEINAKTNLFFSHNRAMLNANQKVKDFLKQSFKDTEKDGWLHLTVSTQETF